MEQIWDDGVVGLRVGDEIVLYDPAQALGPELVGSIIRLTAVRIDVFPTGL